MTDYIKEISKIKTNKTGAIISLHKPLLLLLVLSCIKKGSKNSFLFNDIEAILKTLISKYGLKNTSKINPQYPFVYLASSPFIWECSINKKELKYPAAASRNEVKGKYGNLNDDFFKYLKNKSENLDNTIQFILTEYWTTSYHEDILNDLGLSIQHHVQIKNDRSQSFVLDILNSYERKCAVCSQSIRLGDNLIGIDACHIKPIQHYGEDNVNNGIALCKLHHWALDRGAISINSDLKILISPQINGSESDIYLLNFDGKKIFSPKKQEKCISYENLEYHYNYIFAK